MATSVTVYQLNGRYYTADGLSDYRFEHPESTFTETAVPATRYTVTVSAMDPASCTISLGTTSGNSISSSRREGGVSVKRSTRDNATSTLTYHVYKRNSTGNFIFVYGAHPSNPGYSHFYTSVGCAVQVVTTNAARYTANVGLILDEGSDTWAENREAGSYDETTDTSPYDANKIVYDNSKKVIWFGSNVAPDKAFRVYCGYLWFLAISNGGNAGWVSANSNVRTVANGKTRALVSDLYEYNVNKAGFETRKSTGSLTFAYWYAVRQGLGPYMPTYNGRLLRNFSTTANGVPIILREVNTKSDYSGTAYRPGDDISEILTRRPSLETCDIRVLLYSRFVRRFSVSVVSNGGSAVATFYASPDESSFFSDTDLSARIDAISPPSKASGVLMGLYTEDSTASAKAVNADGTFVSGWCPEADVTIYAQWRNVVDVEFDLDGGAGGDSKIQYDSTLPGFIRVGGTEAISAISIPSKECFAFLGYYTLAVDGTQMIGSDGTLLPSLTGSPPAATLTLRAHWDLVTYKMVLDSQGGTGGPDAVYYKPGTGHYSDDGATLEIENVDVPLRTGYTFGGFYSEQGGGGEQVINDEGGFVSGAQDYQTVYAKWTVKTYTVTFNYNGGTGQVESKEVTWGLEIGTLPTPTPPVDAAEFVGWALLGNIVTSSDSWAYDGDETLVAIWRVGFGDVEDYFGLGNGALVPFESDSGETRPRVVTRAYGRKAADEASSVRWRNPTVRYMVVKDAALSFVLGRGFPGAYSGNTKVATGYMMTQVTVETGLRKFPVVTVSGVANEGGKNGVDAVQTFAFSVDVAARARPQDLLGAIDGGGILQSCTTTFSCDAVVLAENQQPCASDVVNVVREVSAQTLAVGMEEAPSVVQGIGFAEVAKSDVRAGTDRWRYSITARRDQ